MGSGWFTRAILPSVILVALMAILEGLPHRQLDWSGEIVPLARSYAGVAEAVPSEQVLQGVNIVITGCTSGKLGWL